MRELINDATSTLPLRLAEASQAAENGSLSILSPVRGVLLASNAIAKREHWDAQLHLKPQNRKRSALPLSSFPEQW